MCGREYFCSILYKLENIAGSIYRMTSCFTLLIIQAILISFLLTMKSYHERVVHFLATPNSEEYRIDFDDCNIDFIYPDFFRKMLANDMRKVLNALIDAVDVHQSSNLFVSNMILMNYSFYTLKDNPGNIGKLKKYIHNEKLFFQVMSALINRRMYIPKEDFKGLNLGIDLDVIGEEESSI